MSASSTIEPESAFVCDCEEGMRSACTGEPFYKEHEGKRYCVLHFPGTEKSGDFEKALQRKLENKDFDFSGVWFPDPLKFSEFKFGEGAYFGGTTFSAEVDFSRATFSAAAYFGGATFNKHATFRGATFSAEVDFSRATFSEATFFSGATFKAAVTFDGATFNDIAWFTGIEGSPATFSARARFHATIFNNVAVFSGAIFSAAAHFYAATFNGANFADTTFSLSADFGRTTFRGGGRFRQATFGGAAEFNEATFTAHADFYRSTFTAAVDFSGSTFRAGADFRHATLKDSVKFEGRERSEVFSATLRLDIQLELQFARIEKPDRVSFHTLTLRPIWFVNVDTRKFDFTNVVWDQRSVNEEIRSLEDNFVSSRLLSIACRNLAVNAEENHRYREASRFRHMAMDVRRRKGLYGLAPWELNWWYWLASGYGERAAQAFLVLLGILLLSAVLYTQVGFVRWEPRVASESDAAVAKRDGIGSPLPMSRALAYSAAVMTFQKPEPRPATTAAQLVVLVETILGPIQAALLALAIRRKFMR